MKTDRALMDEVLASRPAAGEAYFWWLGQMGFLVRLGEATLMIDGYLSDSPDRLHPPLLRPEALAGVDYVLGSHDHIDHIDREAWRAIARAVPGVRFVVPSPLADGLCRDLDIPRARMIGICEGKQSFEAPGLRIEGIASAHETLDRDARTGEYLYTGFLVSGNGVRFYHAGDCVTYDGLEGKLMAAGRLDAAFLPVNGRDGPRYRSGLVGNMTFQEAVSLTCNLKPGLVVPGHYDMFPGNTANPLDFADYLEARDPSLSYWIGERGTRVRIGG